MIQTGAWFERTFSFNLPPQMYPNILERLRGSPARLEERLVQLPRETLVAREGDKWSIQEHAGHLLDLSALDLGRLDDYEAGLETLRPADLKNRRTYEANHNEQPLENILREFRRERTEFVRRLEGYDEAFITRSALHPRLQVQMRVMDLALFMAEHDDHHLARITELLRMSAP